MIITSVCISSYGQIPGVKLFDFRVRDIQGNFYGNKQWRDRKITNASYNGAYSRNVLQGELQLSSDGSIYHPNMFMYFLNTNLGLNQFSITRADEDKPYEKDHGFFRDAMFRGILLQKKPYNIMFGYLRKFRQLNKDFSWDTNEYVRRWNIGGNWRNQIFPGSVSYISEKNEEYYGGRIINVSDKRFSMSGNWGSNEGVNGNIRITQSDVNRSEIRNIEIPIYIDTLNNIDTLTYDIDSLIYNIDQKNSTLQASVIYPVDKKGNRILQSSIFGNKISGADDITNIIWTNNAKIKIRDNLFSTALYSYRYYNTRYNESKAHNFTADINHQLYLSLLTNAKINSEFFNELDYKKQKIYFQLTLDYKKKLPRGLLKGNLNYQPVYEFIKSQSGMLRQEEYSHIFSEQTSTWIPVQGIQEGSIKVINAEDSTPYHETSDYIISYSDSTFFQIQLVPGSSITDTTEVIIRYMFLGEPTQKTTYTLWGYGISYHLQDYWELVVGYKGNSARYPDYKNTSYWTQDQKQVHHWYLQASYSPVRMEMSREITTSRIIPFSKTEIIIEGILGTYVSQYLSMRTMINWQYYPLQYDRQKQTNFKFEYFRRMSRYLRVKIAWNQRIISGKLNNLKEEKWQTILKHETRNFIFETEYEYSINYIFKEQEINRRWVVRMSVKPWR